MKNNQMLTKNHSKIQKKWIAKVIVILIVIYPVVTVLKLGLELFN